MKHKDLGLELSTRRTRKQILFDELEQVIPRSDSLALITPHAPAAKTGRPRICMHHRAVKGMKDVLSQP